jgi:hypothetical protein
MKARGFGLSLPLIDFRSTETGEGRGESTFAPSFDDPSLVVPARGG